MKNSEYLWFPRHGRIYDNRSTDLVSKARVIATVSVTINLFNIARANASVMCWISLSSTDCSSGSAECSNFSEESPGMHEQWMKKASSLEDLHIVTAALPGPVKTSLECTSMRTAP
jgi:hypothetical protein